MERATRLHLGSGRHPWPGFVNVDLFDDADVKADVRDLSVFPDQSVDEIHAIHLFEHLDRMDVPQILEEWRRVLKIGGLLAIEIPSMNKIARMILNGEGDIRLTLLGIFGEIGSKNPFMAHKWCYTDYELKQVLTDAGFHVELRQPVFHIKERDIRAECRRVK